MYIKNVRLQRRLAPCGYNRCECNHRLSELNGLAVLLQDDKVASICLQSTGCCKCTVEAQNVKKKIIILTVGSTVIPRLTSDPANEFFG